MEISYAAPSEARSVHVALLGLQQALARANEALTVQEGLYRAYTGHLCDLDHVDGLPEALKTAIHDLVVELRTVFGFDQATGTKLTPSTLGRRHARLLVARLESIAARAEALAVDESGRHSKPSGLSICVAQTTTEL
jgi:hypothetical protein